MYKQVKTAKQITLENGVKSEPIATLEDEYGGRCHICKDDHCYILRLGDKKARTTPHIFREAFEVLKTLPSPR